EIYRAALPHADRIYLTRVDAAPDGDARFEPPSEGWRETHLGRASSDARNQFGCVFVRLDRTSVK
ncbi:MAG: dihydrofolate reductase, partial [Parvularculaceae bacterium]|nr:dihydrofolate reductase [Parvularculaceae bacterium]